MSDLWFLLDFESTDLNPLTCRIVQIGCLVWDPDSPEAEEDSFKTLVRADEPMSAEATAITGITTAHLREAPSCREALTSFFEWLHQRRGSRSAILVTYNGHNFDYQLMLSEMTRHRLKLGPTLRGVRFMVDVYCWARINMPSHRCIKKKTGEASLTLGDVHESLLGCLLEGGHDALVDCRALLKVCRSDFVRQRCLNTTQHDGYICLETEDVIKAFEEKRHKLQTQKRTASQSLLAFFPKKNKV